MEGLLAIIYTLTAFFWSAVEVSARPSTLKTLRIFLITFIFFPYFCIKEKVERERRTLRIG